jgi:lysophospholipase L1-like esterase
MNHASRSGFRKRIFILAACAALVVMLGSTYLAGRAMYARRWLPRILEAVAPPVDLRSQPSGAPNTILLLGDSRIADWGLPALPGWRVINAGLAGLTSAELRIIAPDILRSQHPAAVVIQVGVNDLKLVGVRPDLKGSLVSGCVSNVVQVAVLAREMGIRVILTPIWPVGDVPLLRWPVWSSEIPLAIVDCNQRLRLSVASIPGLTVLDFFEPTTPTISNTAWVAQFRDTLHLRWEAYLLFTKALAKHLALTGTSSSL